MPFARCLKDVVEERLFAHRQTGSFVNLVYATPSVEGTDGKCWWILVTVKMICHAYGR
jgi:hypothetical protein